MGVHTVTTVGGPLYVQPVTISNGTSLSAAVDLETTAGIGARLARIDMPAAWTAANLTFQASTDGVTYNNLFDSSGGEYTVTAAANAAIIVPLADFIGIRFLKIRSGTSGTPVNQAADRTLQLVLVR
jgi:hypothetical protein